MKFHDEIPNIDHTWFRPVVRELSEHMIRLLMISDDVKVVDKSNGALRGSSGGLLGQMGRFSYANEDGQIDIIANELTNNEYMQTNDFSNVGNAPIFLDDQIGFSIRPFYVQTKVVIQFTVKLQSDAENRAVRQRIRSLIAGGVELTSTSVQYSYYLPLAALSTCKNIYKLKESSDHDSETMDDWNRRCFSKNLTVAVDPSGKHKLPAIRENQVGLLGQFMFKEGMELSDRDERGKSELTFEYHVNLSRPHSVQIEYPVVILQKTIPKALRYDVPEVTPNSAPIQQNMVKPLISLLEGSDSEFTMINVPSFDDWTPRNHHPRYTPVISLMLSVDTDDRNTIGKLSGLPGYHFSEDTLKYLTDTHDDLSIVRKNLFHVALYRGDVQVTEGVVVDDQLNIRSAYPMDIGQTYRLVVFMCITPNQITENKRYLPMQYPEMVERYITSMNIGYDTFPTVTLKQVTEWWEYLNTRFLKFPNDRYDLFCRSAFTISTYRRG